MSLLLHISDTHFGTELPEVVAALHDLVHAQRPDLLVLSGDITQRATVAQFERARAFLRALPELPKLVLAGNHDVPLFNLWQRVLQPYARFRRGLDVHELAPRLDLAGFALIGVKTTRRRRHIDGEISAAQIEQVAAALERAAPDQLKVVVTHQPLWVHRSEDLHNRCHGADAALERWTQAGADLFLAGHIHWPFVEPLPQRAGSWAINAGTAVSQRLRAGIPNSCNLIRFERAERRCEVERWDCPLDGQGFRRVSLQALTLG